jgi:ADP-ribosyl-[dinitrogen reductase] hydrolase
MVISSKAVVGAVLGTAVGDALGLPYEGLSARRGRRLFGDPDNYHLLFGRGMVSDDTEHTCMVMQALMATGDDDERFAGDLARRLRLWLLGLPAGIGLATLKATLKLWLGFSPRNSGVFSAGNGPAMRSAVLGAAVDDLEQLKRLVRTSTRITHTDPKAETGALAVAMAARTASRGELPDGKRFWKQLQHVLVDAESAEFMQLMDRVVGSVDCSESTTDFAASLGLGKGVSGYMYHSVPVALHAWLSHPRDFRSAVMSVIRCGGDTDTTAAITGGIVGSAVGKQGIPEEWLSGLLEHPRSVAWMERLATELSAARIAGTSQTPPALPVISLLARNLLLIVVVLFHGLRRLLPPY